MLQHCNSITQAILHILLTLSFDTMLSLFAQHYAGVVLITFLSDQAIAFLQGSSLFSSVLLNRLIRIGIDSSCHASIACLMWSSIILDEPLGICFANSSTLCNRIAHHFRKHRREILCAGFISSAIDLDHFIAARSIRLFDAVHLTLRPFTHGLPFAVFFIFTSWLYCSRNDRLERACFLTSTVIGHLLRDSSRRGILFWGKVSTAPLPTPLVLALFAVLMVSLKIIIENHHSLRQDRYNDDPQSLIRERIELV